VRYVRENNAYTNEGISSAVRIVKNKMCCSYETREISRLLKICLSVEMAVINACEDVAAWIACNDISLMFIKSSTKISRRASKDVS
jgi:hypothetical protein